MDYPDIHHKGLVKCPECTNNSFTYTMQRLSNTVTALCDSKSCEYGTTFYRPLAALWDAVEIASAHQCEDKLRQWKEQNPKQQLKKTARAS